MKRVNYFLMASLLLTLTACNKSGSESSNTTQTTNVDFEVTKGQLDAYLKLNKMSGVDGKRRDRVVKSFLERNALAEVVSAQQWKDRFVTDVQIKDTRNQLLINDYLKQYVTGVSSDETVKQYYEDNKTKFEKRKLHLAHIFIRVSKAQKSDSKNSRVKLVGQIVEQLKSGAEFADVAKKHSMDTSTAEKGGDLGWRTNKAGKDLIFSIGATLKMGEVSGPVETNRGYQIVKLLEEPVVETVPFKDVKDKVTYQYKYEKKSGEMKRLRKLAKSRVQKELRKFISD